MYIEKPDGKLNFSFLLDIYILGGGQYFFETAVCIQDDRENRSNQGSGIRLNAN
jgi:hypothetical protein